MNDYLSFSTNGLTLRFGGSPMLIYVDGTMRSSIATYVGRATYRSTTTEPVDLPPLSHVSKHVTHLVYWARSVAMR